MADEVLTQIEEKVKNNKVMLYMKGIKRYSKWPTIPQIYIDGKFVGGCDIVHELHERGELEPMLKAAFGK